MTRNSFRNKWLAAFAGDVPKSDIRKYVLETGNYIWHVFSWELLDRDSFLTGDAAKEAYDKIDKCGAIYIDWFNNKNESELTGELHASNALDSFVEVYVVADDFSWTYIKTHEAMCGPYFLKK